MNQRGSGILLHISSLPSRWGIGDLGPSAYSFVDLLHEAGQKYWQILPLTPTLPAYDNSPYLSSSSFAANPLLISPELMERDSFLEPNWRENLPHFPEKYVDFISVHRWKLKLFDGAFDHSCKRIVQDPSFREFCMKHAWWLDDFALFRSLVVHYGNRSWSSWPRRIKYRDRVTLENVRKSMKDDIEREMFLQYVFFRQWDALHEYCRQKGITIIGDLPLYVSFQSADVWANPDLFMLDTSLMPTAVAGVPPDYFSPKGQLWRNPLYQWQVHETSGFTWWKKRVGHTIQLYDFVRIDHFRGLAAFWEIPAGSQDASSGRWVGGPGAALLKTLKKAFPSFPFIAEDLGIITPDVQNLLKRYHLPGMRVLEFAFTDDNADNPHLPSNIIRNCVLFTGTHDNAPVRGWFEHCTSREDRQRLFHYLGMKPSTEDLPKVFVNLALTSAADTVIIPLQDILGLGLESRMNTPGTDSGNWRWRATSDQLERIDRNLLNDLMVKTHRI